MKRLTWMQTLIIGLLLLIIYQQYQLYSVDKKFKAYDEKTMALINYLKTNNHDLETDLEAKQEELKKIAPKPDEKGNK